MPGLKDIVPAGVVTGENLWKLMCFARDNGFAIPAVNCTSSSTVNAVLQAARDINSPIIIQVSNGGSAFFAGKGISNTNQKASILGSVAGALHVRAMAKHYGVPVVLHSDHCAKNLLEWFDGMLDEDEKYFKEHGEPLFSSHMLDLSEEPLKENIATCVKYFTRMAKINLMLEMELGITGGEEDAVNNENVDSSKLYTQPPEVYQVYEALSPISKMFTIAAAFGNVHGVYNPGTVKLNPSLLGEHQKYCKEKIKSDMKNPMLLVFHGGSGSTKQEISEAVSHGAVKFNIDTDTQWAYWNGIKEFYQKNQGYLQGQIGNPDGPTKPNKKYYDPRVWIRKGEETMIDRVKEACSDLGNVNTLSPDFKPNKN